MCDKLLSGSHQNTKPTFLGLFGQAGSQVGHGLVPNRKCTIGFSAPAQPKMGKEENGMSLLIRKPQSGAEGSGGASGHTPHKCGRLIGEIRSKGLEQGSWLGWNRGCLIPFQCPYLSVNLPLSVLHSETVLRPRAQGSRLPSEWWVKTPTLSQIYRRGRRRSFVERYDPSLKTMIPVRPYAR